MPGVILTPLTNQTFIRDLESEVILRCENKTTDTSRADVWLRDALLEISGNPDYRESFDQLEVTGPVFNLTQGQQEYPFTSLIAAGDYNLKTFDIMLWTDYPTNSVRKKLHYNDFREVDKFQQTQSIPVEWYRFGDNVGFNPVPNNPYQIQARVYRRHPLPAVNLRDNQVLLPQEWNEVLIWAAVMRGYMEYLEFEKAQGVRTMLYGDPKHPDKPGMIDNIKIRRRAEAWFEESALRPIVRGYGYGHS